MRYAKLSDYDYFLPDELIATHPAEPRDSSRLLVLDKKTGKIEHKHFYDIIDYLRAGDILVLNNSKVIPARLWARKKLTGGKVEVLLHKKLSANVWQCLLGGRVQEGLEILFPSREGWTAASAGRGVLKMVAEGDRQTTPSHHPQTPPRAGGGVLEKEGGLLRASIMKNNHDGTWDLKFNKSGAALMKTIEKIGEVPLPPYIENQRKNKREKRINKEDKKEYQTVYADAKKAGSVAAPTAGLHFTPALLKKINKKGVKILEITLYVGMGTFAPVKTEDITKHVMHSEFVEISGKVIEEIKKNKEQRSKNKSGRIIAVGTTSARSLEACFSVLTHPASSTPKADTPGSAPLSHARFRFAGQARGEFKSWVDIFVYPGYKFKVVDALITNFHLPKSTLLMLVSALAGKKNIDHAYREAIKKKYRFYSYGDAMFIK
ncbi:MAG: S-adenosylmethionine:tRNA ribosyltransferase-isomerase [Patescibacteria group bacterium]|nr:S-adenosylmethionine:tRNA ribosyltransferase-isomerase [Patescibacteria group bacterium]